jgi:hypothetical protein
MAAPKGAVSPRRLNVTPELMADVRRRYQQTDEPLATLAADLGCSTETVRNIAKREQWVRHVPPPRDLTRAAKLRIQAEALAQAREQGACTPRAAAGRVGRRSLRSKRRRTGWGAWLRHQRPPPPSPPRKGEGVI